MLVTRFVVFKFVCCRPINIYHICSQFIYLYINIGICILLRSLPGFVEWFVAQPPCPPYYANTLWSFMLHFHACPEMPLVLVRLFVGMTCRTSLHVHVNIGYIYICWICSFSTPLIIHTTTVATSLFTTLGFMAWHTFGILLLFMPAFSLLHCSYAIPE